MDAKQIIEQLNLKPLPEEGGYFKETFRDSGKIPAEISKQLDGEHSYSTCIYYLITQKEFSSLHTVKSTEIFHFYTGDPVEMIQIKQNGELEKYTLGSDLINNQKPQIVVPPNTWQGTKLKGDGKWALMGCTVAPGFEFSDFTGTSFEELSKIYPQHSDLIKEYTHK